MLAGTQQREPAAPQAARRRPREAPAMGPAVEMREPAAQAESNTGTADASTDSASVVHDASSDASPSGTRSTVRPTGAPTAARAGRRLRCLRSPPVKKRRTKFEVQQRVRRQQQYALVDRRHQLTSPDDRQSVHFRHENAARVQEDVFWAGGVNGMNGPDPRDYPGALDVSVSTDCTTFGPTIGAKPKRNPVAAPAACRSPSPSHSLSSLSA